MSSGDSIQQHCNTANRDSQFVGDLEPTTLLGNKNSCPDLSGGRHSVSNIRQGEPTIVSSVKISEADAREAKCVIMPELITDVGTGDGGT